MERTDFWAQIRIQVPWLSAHASTSGWPSPQHGLLSVLSFHTPRLQGPAAVPSVWHMYSVRLVFAFIRFVLLARALIQCHEQNQGFLEDTQSWLSTHPLPITSPASEPAMRAQLPKAHSAGLQTALCQSPPPPHSPLEETWRKIQMGPGTCPHSWWKPIHFKDANHSWTSLV